MNFSKHNPVVRNSGVSDAEETLRLIASLPAPEGIEKRIEAGLRVAPHTTAGRARILSWPVAWSLQSAWVRAAAAAAIVFVVLGGGWGVVALVQSSQPARAIAAPPDTPHGVAPGGFSNAGAMRTPLTLDHPVVAQPAAVEPTAAPTVQPVAKPAANSDPQASQKPLRHGMSAVASKPVPPSAITK